MNLLKGDRVAWTIAPDNHWSAAHRMFLLGRTFCSRTVPNHATTSLHPKQVTHVCARCERMYQNAARYERERVSA